MKQKIDFWVPGRPMAWQRAGFNAKGQRFFTKPETRAWKKTIMQYAKAAMVETGFKRIESGPVLLRIWVVFQSPKSKKACHWKASKPDWDNIGKSPSDALNEILYKDDSQIVDAHITKIYGSKEGLRIYVEEL